MSRVAVVVPAFQGGSDLLACLASVAASDRMPEAVLVVDNASTDGSIESAQSRFPDVEILRNAENLGFGSACNRGIEQAMERRYDFVLVLNQDALLEPETLASMLELATEHPRAAVVGAKTVSTTRAADGSPALLYNGAWRRVLPLWQRIPGIGGSSRATSTEPREVDYVWGHGMLLRCDALDEVGAFDAGFFMYYEDLDLCWRLQRAGWEIWCDSRAVIHHAVEDGARATRSEAKRWRMKAESARYFHRKWCKRPLADAIWTLSTLRELAPLFVEGHRRAAADLVRAWWEVVRTGR